MHLGTTVDGFFHFKVPSSLSYSSDNRVKYHSFADGGQAATVFGGLPPTRSWRVDFNKIKPGQLGMLPSFANDATWYDRGRTGVQFLPSGAEYMNMLTRAESNLTKATSGYGYNYVAEPVVTDEGDWYGYMSIGNVYTRVASDLPVLPDRGEFRVSLCVRGTVNGIVYYRAGDGSTVGASGFTFTGGAATFVRKSTVIPGRLNARYVDIEVTGDYTKPSVTAGQGVYAWGEGQRVPSVVVEQTGEEVQWIGTKNPKARFITKPAFTITELREGSL